VPDALAVGATTTGGDRRASFSSYGPEVDVVAAGEGIVGTIAASRCSFFLPCISGQPYARGNGTSFSTPQVAGLAALILSMNPGMTPWQLSDIIKNSATAMAAGTTPGWPGAGRINMPAALRSVRANTPPGEACIVQTVIDGESFVCGGRTVRLLQVDAPNLGECGGQWAKDALQNIFLIPGRTVYLRYDVVRVDPQSRTLAAPLWRGSDGSDYNLSVIMVYVGLARAADIGQGNGIYRDWALSSQAWATAAGWNMWAPGKPFRGGC
jgi:endonuclease YncB( thermonuclease family)